MSEFKRIERFGPSLGSNSEAVVLINMEVGRQAGISVYVGGGRYIQEVEPPANPVLPWPCWL